MDTMKIEYKFNFSDFLNRKCLDADSVESAIRITINDVVITKMIDNQTDDGFLGENITSVFAGWLNAVPKLLAGEPHSSFFLDSPDTIDFRPKNGLIYIRYWYPEEHCWDHPDNENDKRFYEHMKKSNREYPNFPDGTPVPPSVLINEFIRVSEDFLAFIEPYDKEKDRDIAELHKELKRVKEFWKGKSKEYPNPAGNT